MVGLNAPGAQRRKEGVSLINSMNPCGLMMPIAASCLLDLPM
jgi:hypothetical protein